MSPLDAPPNDRFADFKLIIRKALDRGLTIHPVKPRGKEPWLNGWPKAASRNPDVIQEWVTRFPTSNYGVVATDEFCILESDNLPALMERISRGMPFTYMVQARANRPHIYFRQTSKSKAAGNMDCPGIFEFKQNNRYVVGEGSVHPEGMIYTCIKEDPIVEIPDWLITDLQSIRSGRGVRNAVPLKAEGETYGVGEGRHQLLMRKVAQMWDGKMTEEEFLAKAQRFNEEHCDPPKETGNLLDEIRWIMKRPPADRGPVIVVGKSEPPPVTPVWGIPAGQAIEKLADMPPRTPLMWELGRNGAGDQVLFYRGSLNQIFAWRGLGKTNLALRMAACFAKGEQDFLGFRAQASRVIYVDGELPLEQLYERARTFGLTNDVLLISPENINQDSINLFNPFHYDKLIEAIDAHIGSGHDGVLFLDSQAMLMKGDPLKEQFQSQRLDMLYKLRRKGVCVIEMHHSGKDIDRQRGSSRNDDGLDIQIQLSPCRDHDSDTGLRFEWTVRKKRHETLLDSGFVVTLQDGVWSRRVSDEQQAVEEALQEGVSLRKIATDLDITLSKVARLKRKIAQAGRQSLNEKHKSQNQKEKLTCQSR